MITCQRTLVTLGKAERFPEHLASRQLGNGARIQPVLLPDILDEVSHRTGMVEWQRRKIASATSKTFH